MPDVIITPNSGLIEFKPSSTTVNKIEASGNTFNLVNTANPSGTIFNIEATNGSLFSVVDNLNGTLMSVNNNAGLPVLEVFSDDRIIGGRFGYNDFVVSSSGNVGIGKVPNNSYKLDVNGSLVLNNSTVSDVFVINPTLYSFALRDSNADGIFETNDSLTHFKALFENAGLFFNRLNAKVGIKTSSPSHELHVAGNILCDKLYLEKTSTLVFIGGSGSGSGGLTIDLADSQLFLVSLDSNITTLTISNTPVTSNIAVGFTIIFTADGTARSVTWPASVKWAGGTAPTLTSTNTKRDVLSFISTDNGTSWLGFVGGQNY